MMYRSMKMLLSKLNMSIQRVNLLKTDVEKRKKALNAKQKDEPSLLQLL